MFGAFSDDEGDGRDSGRMTPQSDIGAGGSKNLNIMGAGHGLRGVKSGVAFEE